MFYFALLRLLWFLGLFWKGSWIDGFGRSALRLLLRKYYYRRDRNISFDGNISLNLYKYANVYPSELKEGLLITT